MKVIDCYEVHQWDGGDRQNFAFYLASREEAELYKRGAPHDRIVPKTLIIFDTMAEVLENERQAARERALSKLNSQEIDALGLRDEWEKVLQKRQNKY